MTCLRTLVVAIGLAAAATGQAAAGNLDNPARIFAGCAGRLSAEMEHLWLVGGDSSEITRHRATMIDLIDAIRGPDDGRALLAHRLEAKFAQAKLLQRASFDLDPDAARRATLLASAARDRCLSLLPGA